MLCSSTASFVNTIAKTEIREDFISKRGGRGKEMQLYSLMFEQESLVNAGDYPGTLFRPTSLV